LADIWYRGEVSERRTLHIFDSKNDDMNDDSSCILLSFVIAMMIVIIDSPW
jgi:hypothetical protein